MDPNIHDLASRAYGDALQAAIGKMLDAAMDDVNARVDRVVEAAVSSLGASVDELQRRVAAIPVPLKGDKGDKGNKGDKGDRGLAGSVYSDVRQIVTSGPITATDKNALLRVSGGGVVLDLAMTGWSTKDWFEVRNQNLPTAGDPAPVTITIRTGTLPIDGEGQFTLDVRPGTAVRIVRLGTAIPAWLSVP